MRNFFHDRGHVLARDCGDAELIRKALKICGESRSIASQHLQAGKQKLSAGESVDEALSLWQEWVDYD